ncbi:MAG: hypothetical protein ACOY4B_09420 [Pseudomonadota bacterium]
MTTLDNHPDEEQRHLVGIVNQTVVTAPETNPDPRYNAMSFQER